MPILGGDSERKSQEVLKYCIMLQKTDHLIHTKTQKANFLSFATKLIYFSFNARVHNIVDPHKGFILRDDIQSSVLYFGYYNNGLINRSG